MLYLIAGLVHQSLFILFPLHSGALLVLVAQTAAAAAAAVIALMMKMTGAVILHEKVIFNFIHGSGKT